MRKKQIYDKLKVLAKVYYINFQAYHSWQVWSHWPEGSILYHYDFSYNHCIYMHLDPLSCNGKVEMCIRIYQQRRYTNG